MPIFQHKQNRVLFLHIPKTGGSSIETALKNRSQISLATEGVHFQEAKPFRKALAVRLAAQHLPFRELKFLLGDAMPETRVCMVRDPYDRMESSYAYNRKLGNIPVDLPFEKWVCKTLAAVTCHPFVDEGHYLPQSQFAGANVNVFHYEQGLDPLLHFLEAQLGLEAGTSAPRDNRSEREPVEWSVLARHWVNVFYAEDFERFNYAKVNPELTQSGLKWLQPRKHGYLLGARIRFTLSLLKEIWFKSPRDE